MIERQGKPRTSGITYARDRGIGLGVLEGMLDMFGEYIDVLKLSGFSYRLTWEMLREVRERGAQALVKWNNWAEKYPWQHSDPPHFHDFMGFPEIRATEKKYLPPEEEEKYQDSLGLYTPGEKPDVPKKFEWR